MSRDPRTVCPGERSAGGDRLQGQPSRYAYRRLAGVLEKDQTNLQALLLQAALLLSDGLADEALASVNTASSVTPTRRLDVRAGRIQVARRQSAAALRRNGKCCG